MSTGASIWRNAVSLVTHSRGVTVPPQSGELHGSATRHDPALVGLTHQLFSFQPGVGRKRIFFAGSGPETDVRRFCRRMGNCLAGTVTSNVALVWSGPRTDGGIEDPDNFEMYTARGAADEVVQRETNLWSVPFQVFQRQWEQTRSTGMAAGYEYAILGATVSDSMAPVLSQCCDGTVLVLAANQTRREAALRAKELLGDWNANLLGAVLDNRTFPIPESIYRRL